ncbi:MAG: 3-hydroxyacyl-CoA dehydrogenase NAD-binding domain-containing protein [Marinomonas sp.]
MARPNPNEVTKIGVIGTGVIGGGWALHFLRMGMEVVAYDPGPNAKEKLMAMIDKAWPTIEQLGLREGASRDKLRFVDVLEDMVSCVEVIQENTPERLDAKQALFAELDRIAPADVVIISSTSGFPMTDMAVNLHEKPERFIVGHPFNPPYLMPFCEVVGGEKTSQNVVDWTAAFYESIEKQVAKMDKEVPGFIGNRIQEAIWREVLYMVKNNECSVEDVDKAIIHGLGLRWAIMGHCLTYHLGGGQGGMAYLLDHFEHALEEPLTRLKAPEVTQDLKDNMVQGCLNQANGASIDDLVQERDDCLVRIMQTLSEYRLEKGIKR